MLKRKWHPLSAQDRIAEALNAAPRGISLAALCASDYLADLSARAITINVGLLAKRGDAIDFPSAGKRLFCLTDQGKRKLDLQRTARARLAQRLRMDIPVDTYPQSHSHDLASPEKKSAAIEAIAPVLLSAKPEEADAHATVTATIARHHLRALVTRALDATKPLTESDREALCAAIKEAA